jgi:hypothetical protein
MGSSCPLGAYADIPGHTDFNKNVKSGTDYFDSFQCPSPVREEPAHAPFSPRGSLSLSAAGGAIAALRPSGVSGRAIPLLAAEA